MGVPRLRQTVLDTEDPRRLAEFYRVLLGLAYRPGDEQVDPAGDDWLVLVGDGGVPALAFQRVDSLPHATWPAGERPQMLHLDTTVATASRTISRTVPISAPAPSVSSAIVSDARPRAWRV